MFAEDLDRTVWRHVSIEECIVDILWNMPLHRVVLQLDSLETRQLPIDATLSDDILERRPVNTTDQEANTCRQQAPSLLATKLAFSRFASDLSKGKLSSCLQLRHLCHIECLAIEFDISWTRLFTLALGQEICIESLLIKVLHQVKSWTWKLWGDAFYWCLVVAHAKDFNKSLVVSRVNICDHTRA